MLKQREALLIASVGKKGIGKTEQTLKMILSYVKGNPSAGIKPAKAILCDVNEEFGHVDLKSIKKTAKIKALALNDVALFSRQTVCEARRIRFFNEDGSPMTLDEIADAVFFVLQNFKDGLILIEDPTKFMARPKKDLLGSIATQRHKSVDILLHYQFFGKILNPSVFGNLNIVRLHATIDSVEKYKYDIGDQYELFRVAESIVNLQVKSGNPRFFIYINLDNSKISGAFTEKQFMEGVDDYLINSHKSAIKPILDRKDANGKKMFNNETAYRNARQTIYDSFYGNLDS